MVVSSPTNTSAPKAAPERSDAQDRLLERLDEAFGQKFAVIDPSASVLERVSADWPRVDIFRWIALCEQVGRAGRVEVIEEHAPLVLLAVPLPSDDPFANPGRTAVAVLLSEPTPSIHDLESAAAVFGIDAGHAASWAKSRRAAPVDLSVRLAEAILEAESSKATTAATKRQLSETSGQLLATFEELNLLHRLTGRLSIEHSEQELCENAASWLAEVVDADAVVGRIEHTHENDASTGAPDEAAQGPLTVFLGPSALVDGDLGEFFDRLGPDSRRRAVVLNRDRTGSPTWCYPGVREVVSAPIIANGELIGWLAILNRTRKGNEVTGGFGAVEASLLASVAAILGVHAGNRRQFRDHTELFGSAVRALSSAIDAKDPYTCGHSDRVARIAVRLAEHLGFTDEALNEVYLGGLLHDVGKIGIDDVVLRKPDKLTDDEYDHIKTHPELGVRILSGVRQLSSILPIVGHHHESWDGSGYPGGLAGEETPIAARVMAVADAIDAMGSDRPYRKGMPRERVEAILREGAGRQWDTDVIAAYFAAADDIAEITRVERAPLDLDVSRWGKLSPNFSSDEQR